MDSLTLSADWASIIGLAVSFGGFGFAIWQITKVRSAADAATNAANEARNAIGRMSAVEACAAAIQQMEELKGLHRRKQFDILPDKYAAVRFRLVEIKSDIERAEARQFVDAAIESYADMEREYDSALRRGDEPEVDFDKINAKITIQTLKLSEIAAELRKQS